MNAQSSNKLFWTRMMTIVMVMMMVLATLPVQSAQAAIFGFSAPTTYFSSAMLNPTNAYVSDNVYVQSNGNNKSAVYGNFGFSLPAGATVNLVEVKVEGHGTKNWKVAVSNNNGASYSSYVTINNTANDVETVTGGPGTLWGLTGWTPASLSNANFRVKIASAGGSPANVAYLDALTVRVTYTPINATPSTLVIAAPAAGIYGGTVNLQATLTSNGIPLSGQSVSFSLDGFPRGDAVTDGSGVATLFGVQLTTGLSNTTLNVGSYEVAATFFGDSTYAFSTDTDTQVINPLAVTVTADAKGKAYGTNDPALTYSVVPSLIGSDAFSGGLSRVAGENVGTYAITQGTLSAGPNYAITFVGADLTITPFGITVTADDKAVNAGNEPTYTFGVSEFVGSDTFITEPTCGVSGVHSALGTYAIVCDNGDAGPNYTITYVSGTLTVTNKVILDVEADPQSVEYGNADPIFTASYSGFDPGDDKSVINVLPTCGVTGSHTNVGTYPSIRCSGGSDNKYAFNFTSGTLTVTPRAITVTADAKNKTYGTSDPALTYSFNPALVGSDTFSGELSRNAGEDAGSYAITQGTLALGFNYTINYSGNNLTINPAPLTVTADDKTNGQGVTDPVFTFSYDGFVNGDVASAINTPPTCGVTGAHLAVGAYPITCTGGSDNNYSFNFVDGTLLIVQNEADVKIGATFQQNYTVLLSSSTRQTYTALNTGPVQINSVFGGKLASSIRVIYGGVSYSEMMGLPVEQLSQEYWFPSYNNVNLNSQLRVGNLGNVPTTISVYLGNTRIDQYTLAAGAATRKNYSDINKVGLNGGPLRVVSSATKILSTIRLLYNNTSFSELMGLPKEQLTNSYLFPYYNNVAMTSNLQVSNVGTVATTIKVYLGTTQIDTFSLAAKSTLSKNYPGQNSGPLKVTSSAANIVPSIRVLYNNQSYSEMIGYPANKLTNEYWYPVYDNATLNSQLRVSNVGTGPTTITVYVGNSTTPIASYSLAAGKASRYNYSYNTGPLHVVSSSQPILSTVRELYTTSTFSSFYELMGMPKTQLSTQYYFPWYNNAAMNSELRFALP